MTQNVKWHKVSNDTKCQMTQNIKWHKMSNDTKFQMTRNDTWHMTYDTWQMTNETWQMTHETKFQIAHYTHDTWHMIHDTWHMRYDVWCMTHDAWWSMTPDRNTRRHTLRSVHSSPGRPFLLSTSSKLTVYLKKMSALVVSKMNSPEALIIDGEQMPTRLLSIVQDLMDKDLNE